MTLVLASAIFVTFASEEVGIIFTKEDAKQTKYLDPSTANVNISFEDAKNKIISENPEVINESIYGELIDDENFGIIWQISSKTTNGKSILTGIDASNGEQLFVYDGSKNVQGRYSISEDDALKIAEEYIKSRVSADKINDIELEYVNYIEPPADDLPGNYHVSYARIIRGIPSLSDGILLDVNAETGEVSSYDKSWSMSEEEIALIDTEPSITDEKAVEILKEYMSNEPSIGEEKANTVKVISSNLVWKEDDEDKIHLAWWIRFMDSSFAKDATYPASVWIDAHSGEMLLFDYYRD
ncbi:YcdB/YcdC domain-containing protein [Methanosarcina sp.]|uniref:YcdB/YcdC domain-containing protein n=1 Tax=Methanosarcina sp. TaxID=2213 RepID=UPI002988B3EB|nr:YcdB/YcdC domain-containing protein [Methanosarcina sp.]MDW5548664.1 PepSY domain-containing protein [Methanosarcina sp.]MDW5553871.1 PepSY domain-containing protein [Methanosarcina sp.]MDW5558804.1 PepSY domain-containing protein [Methanosarcina sp.]